jgi:hypothetical protein
VPDRAVGRVEPEATGDPLPTTSGLATMKVTIYGWSTRRLRNPDRQNVVYAAALLVMMPRSANRACMAMRKVS